MLIIRSYERKGRTARLTLLQALLTVLAFAAVSVASYIFVYKDLRDMRWFLIVLGAAMAAALTRILLRRGAANMKEEERAHAALDLLHFERTSRTGTTTCRISTRIKNR